MAKFVNRALASAIAAGMLITAATPIAFADPPRHGPGRGHGSPRSTPRRAWAKGQHFDARYAPNYQVVDYRRYHRLRPPPRGYRWVRSGNDAVLVAITSGIVASVIANGMMN